MIDGKSNVKLSQWSGDQFTLVLQIAREDNPVFSTAYIFPKRHEAFIIGTYVTRLFGEISWSFRKPY